MEAADQFAKKVLQMPGEEAYEEIRLCARLRTPASGRLLLELLKHRSAWLRQSALDALWEFGRLQDARKGARLSIQSKNVFVRNTACEMLGEVGTRLDVPLLIDRLRSDKDWVVRTSAASSLGDLRTRAGVAALMNSLSRDRYWCVRAYAADALCRHGDKRFESPILSRIAKDPEPAVLPSLYAAMMDMGREEYVDKVIDLLFDDGYWYMVYLRACVVLESAFIDNGRALPDRAIKGLRLVSKYDVGKAANWSARRLLAASKKVGGK